jgi:5-methylcytosine-specific restriction endonuclease McrA
MKQNMKKNQTGKNNPNFRENAVYRQKKFCLDCGVSITPYSQRCYSCSSKKRYKDNPSLITIVTNNFRIMKGKDNPSYIDGRSMTVNTCVDCGIKLTDYRFKRCKPCSLKNPERLRKIGLSQTRELHWNWQGGKSEELYPLGWTLTYKEQIRRRDKYICQNCGVPEIESIRRLHVHHIDYNKKNISSNNLVSLCQKCHMKTNFKRDYWIKYFKGDK